MATMMAADKDDNEVAGDGATGDDDGNGATGDENDDDNNGNNDDDVDGDSAMGDGVTVYVNDNDGDIMTTTMATVQRATKSTMATAR